jgi:hypothetical protein
VARRFRFGWVLILPLLLVVAVPVDGQQADRRFTVTAAAQVTTNPNPVRAHSSPQIARNPKNGELVIVETDVYAGFGVNVHISRDEGRSWFRGGDPMMKPFVWNSDLAINGPYATLAFDRDAVLNVAFSATDPKYANVNRSERPRPVFLARSTDSGRSFTTRMVYEAKESDPKSINNRRSMVTVDPENPDNIYVAWIQTSTGEKSRSMLAASTNGGRTFRAPVDLAAEEPQGGYQPRVAVGPDGAVHAIYPGGGYTPMAPAGQPAPEAPVRPIFYRQSTDNGRTWSRPVKIDEGAAGFAHNRKQLLAADPNNGNLYAVWYGTAAPTLRPTDTDDNEIFVRVSRDNGRTWSDRVTVNDDARSTNVQHYDAGISIAPNGRVDIAWYDFRNSPEPEKQNAAAPFNIDGFTDVYYSYSTDEGRTFARNVRISDRMQDRRIGVWSNNVHSHYNVGIASTNDAVYFAWQDSRNGNATTDTEDVYFASLLRTPPQVSVEDGSDVPGWVIAGTAAAVGMGVAMLLIFLASRRSRPQAARVVAP